MESGLWRAILRKPKKSFDFDKQGLTREQVMMLDILANNDWKRGIFFSSPGGSDVAYSLYRRGHIKQLGLKDTLWKREWPAQMAFPPIVTSMLLITTFKGDGFYVELFLFHAFPLE